MNEEIPSRRLILRGALVAGCSLIVPVTLFSSTAIASEAVAPGATKKMSQASVQYQTQPKGELKCGSCANFIAKSNSCKLVDGKISAEGWCSLWTKKT